MEANEHTKHWQQVFQRLVAIVQFLAERNLALRGTERMFVMRVCTMETFEVCLSYFESLTLFLKHICEQFKSKKFMITIWEKIFKMR